MKYELHRNNSRCVLHDPADFTGMAHDGGGYMNDINKGFKIFTHDFRPPIQGGDPIWDGGTPFSLPTVSCDDSDRECSNGWNYVADLAIGFKIAGIWPTGRPSSCFVVEAENGIERGDKRRAASLHILRACTQQEIEEGIDD